MLERLYNLIIIISLFFMGISYGSSNVRSEIARKRSDNLTYQLTRDVIPQHYTLKISPEMEKMTFTGYVMILIHVTTPIISITLHQKKLSITKEKIYLTAKDGTVIRIKDAGVSGTNEQQFYTITLNNILQENTYNLTIPEFHGVMTNSRKGFFYVRYIEKFDYQHTMAMSDFEPTYARYVFPCFDEPSFRAEFKIYIIRPPDYHSIANTKLMTSKKIEHKLLYEDEFETTPLMPTHLVGFIISKMKLSPLLSSNFYRVLARTLVMELGYNKYAFNLSKIVLPTLETYLKVNYSLNKIDQAAIPNTKCEAGVMENWGLVSYVEDAFLFTPRTTTKMHLNIDTTITHELAHQWFGNLVTMKWWTYVWLKEGFATFLENRITDMIKPEWKLMQQFIVILKHDSLEADSTRYTRAMNQDVGTPEEINNVFDIISYQKAACVIHMLEAFMTAAIFQRGLTYYLKDRSYQSAVPSDLYRNLQQAVNDSGKRLPKNLNIHKIMTTWDSQKGCLLIKVERNYGISQEVVKLTQFRYTDDRNIPPKRKRWFIPINYATKSNPNFKDTRFDDWLVESNALIIVENLFRTDWLILNKQEAYYYRVNYDYINWKLITDALLQNYTNIHILNRVQLIDDSFHLAKTYQLDFKIFLKITTYLYREDNYITHCAFLRAAKYIIINILSGAHVERTFKAHIIRILKPAYERLGYKETSKDTVIDKLHRVLVLQWMCRLNYAKCRRNAREMFNRWRYHHEQISINFEELTLCSTIRIQDQTDWEYLFTVYQSIKKNEGFKWNAFQSLACTEDVYSLNRLLDVSLKSATGSAYDFSKVVSLLSNKGLSGLEVAMNYIAAHFQSLFDTFGQKYITTILKTIASKLTTKEQVKKFDQILKKHRSLKEKKPWNLKQTDLRVSANQKRVHQISKFFYGVRSNGNRNLIIPTTCYFILYSLLIIVLLF